MFDPAPDDPLHGRKGRLCQICGVDGPIRLDNDSLHLRVPPKILLWRKQRCRCLRLITKRANKKPCQVDRGINASPQTGLYAAKATLQGFVLCKKS